MRQYALTFLFIALFVAFHAMSSQFDGAYANFSPFVALFFCGAAFYRHSRLLLPIALIAWLIAAPLTALLQGYTPHAGSLTVQLLSYAAIAGFGKLLTGKKTWILLLGALGCGIFFHLTTNLFCFFTDPLYVKNWTGLTQAFWSIPPHPTAVYPTAFFLRNLCAATVLFSALFMIAAAMPYFRKPAAKKWTSSAPQS